MKRLTRLVSMMVAVVVSAWLPVEPAAAVGVGDVEFSVHGSLPRFPCLNCTVNFTGSGTGSGNAQALVGLVHYDATFTVLNGTVSGWANYTEPELPLCPAYGSAAGAVTLSGGATGIIHSSAAPHHTGTVSNVTFTLQFSYVRVGSVPVITVKAGSVTVSYYIPTIGYGSFTNSIVGGAGTGLFVVDPVEAVSECVAHGSLPFQIVGNATVASL